MNIDWTKVRRVIFNHKLIHQKPTKEDLQLISERLPDVVIFGFGVYSNNFVSKTWYALVYSRAFAIDEQPGFQNVNIRDLPRITLYVVP